MVSPPADTGAEHSHAGPDGEGHDLDGGHKGGHANYRKSVRYHRMRAKSLSGYVACGRCSASSADRVASVGAHASHHRRSTVRNCQAIGPAIPQVEQRKSGAEKQSSVTICRAATETPRTSRASSVATDMDHPPLDATVARLT
jgi:hypothetical protein